MSDASRFEAPTRGKCRLCGCVESRACPDGCSWADDTETLCTACVELVAMMPAELRSKIAALLDRNQSIDDVLLEGLLSEFREAQADGICLDLGAIPAFTAFQLCGLLQLALRHPDLADTLRDTGVRMVTLFDQVFQQSECPTATLIIRRGNDPGRTMVELSKPSADEAATEDPEPRRIILPGEFGG